MSTGLPKILYDNRLADATPVASSTDAGDYNVLNLRDWKPYTWWKPISLPATIKVNSAIARAADYALIVGHDLNTTYAAVVIDGSNDDFATWASVASSNLIPYSSAIGSWNLVRASVISNMLRSPSTGTRTLDKLVEDATAANNHYCALSANTGTQGAYVSARLKLKAAERTKAQINIWNAGGGLLMAATVNLADGTANVTTGTGAIALIEDGVYEVTLYSAGGISVASGTVDVYVLLLNAAGSDTYNGDGTSGLYVGDVHVNVGNQNVNKYQETSGTENPPIFLPFTSISYQYWRLRVLQTAGASIPSLAIASIGTALQIPRRLKEGFDPIGREPQAQSNRSEAGHPLGRVIDFEMWSETLSWKNLNWNFVRNSFVPAWQAHLRGNPFAFAWDPTDHADEVYLLEMKKGFKTPHRVGEYCDLSFDVQGVVP